MDRPMDGPERRSTVRVPLGCAATIMTPAPQPHVEAVCADIGVGGMTLLTRYVPCEGEKFDVLVEPPAGSPGGTMHARVRVRRCQARGDGRFELGVQIVKVIR